MKLREGIDVTRLRSNPSPLIEEMEPKSAPFLGWLVVREGVLALLVGSIPAHGFAQSRACILETSS